jgi:hypothetical protein
MCTFAANKERNILHARIRNNCSALRNDLFHANLIHNPSCSCGYSTENAEHFLLYCKRFGVLQHLLIHTRSATNQLSPDYIHDNQLKEKRHVSLIYVCIVMNTCLFVSIIR